MTREALLFVMIPQMYGYYNTKKKQYKRNGSVLDKMKEARIKGSRSDFYRCIVACDTDRENIKETMQMDTQGDVCMKT